MHIWMKANLQWQRKEKCVRKITLTVLRHSYLQTQNDLKQSKNQQQPIKMSFESTWRWLRSHETEKVREFKVITLIKLDPHFFQASELQGLEHTFNLGFQVSGWWTCSFWLRILTGSQIFRCWITKIIEKIKTHITPNSGNSSFPI